LFLKSSLVAIFFLLGGFFGGDEGGGLGINREKKIVKSLLRITAIKIILLRDFSV